jgi:LPS-assembly protein
MHKITKSSLLSLLFAAAVSAADFTDEYVQIVSKDMETINNVITANTNVVVYSKNYYITANKLIYDKNNSKLELFENVNITKNNENIMFSEYALIDVDDEFSILEPFLLIDNTTGLWLGSDRGDRKKDEYILKDTSLSSCDCVNPDWNLEFSEGTYNTTKQWIDTYNTTLYLNDFPVFYTPYFGFPTDTSRRTGLLRPTVGFSSDQGFMYEQPIYYAPQPNYDIEFVPMVRSRRGYGADLTYRFADSPYSMLKLNGGFFKESGDYAEEKNLTNDKHIGWSIDYKRSKLFSDENSKDGLYVDVKHMNDIDYLTTKYKSDAFDDIDRYVESQVKYFYDDYKYYFDINSYYYRDLQTNNNDVVMQELPSTTLHKYSDKLFFDGFTYSANVNFDRKTRKEGIGANTTSVSIPVGFYTTFFNDYLNLSFTEELKYSNVDFTNDSDLYEDLHYWGNTHSLSVYMDLLKKYDDFTHAVKFDISHSYDNAFYKEGDVYNLNNINALSQFSINEPQKSISWGINQSFYNNEDLTEILNHKILQAFVYDGSKNSYEKRYLENEIALNFYVGKLINKVKYNYNIDEISDNTSSLNFKYDIYSFNTSYKFKRNINTLETTETVNYKFTVDLFDDYRLSYRQEYDLKTNKAKKTEYIFNIDKKCWAVNFKYVDSYQAINSTLNDVINQDEFYVELNLKQLFKLNQVFNFE